MAPNDIDENSELISAMSALNTHDERKPYTGTFLTDDIPSVKLAYKLLIDAFDILMNNEKFYSERYINYCNSAIIFLNRREDENELKYCNIHPMIAHSIEHIECAIKINKRRKKIQWEKEEKTY